MRNFKEIIRNSLVISIFLFVPLFAQGTGSIQGVVTDSSNGDPLIGANVMVVGTVLGAAVDKSGKYRIRGIDTGKQKIRFSYLGYHAKVVEVEIIKNRSIELNISLQAEAIVSEDVVVTAMLQGQKRAINEQISSNTIVNVVSKDKIEELPDQNAAESLSRLPGISIQRNAGEGQKIVIRGLAPKFNVITLDGVAIPSTDEEDRSVDLSMISSDMLGGIEVYKALTPDKDADAIGGSVNFTMKKAPNNTKLDVKLQGGYNNHENYYGNYKGTIGFSNRYFDNKFGLVLTGNLQRANRGSDGLTGSYEFTREERAGEDRAVITVTDLNLVDRKEIRDRYGASLALDYDLGNGGIMFTSFYSKTERNETRRRKRYRVGNFRTEYDYRNREINVGMFTNILSGKHNLSFMDIDWKASLSMTEQRTPFEFDNRFRELAAFRNDIIDDQGPQYIPTGAKNNLDVTFFKNMNIYSRAVDDKNIIGEVNTKFDYNLSNDVAGYLKLGAKYRYKDRDRNNTKLWTSHFNLNDIGILYSKNPDMFYRSFTLTPDRKLQISNFLSSDDIVGPFLDNQYDFGPSLDGNSLREFYDHMRYFRFPSDSSALFINDPTIQLQDYTAKEGIFATYVMTEIDLGARLMILPGVRYEYTENSYKSIFGEPAGGEDETPNLVNVKDTTGGQSYGELLPMLHVRYKFTDWFDTRIAITRSLARPNYFNLVPWEEILRLDSEINKGNPFLEHTKVWNYDLFLSFYNRYGLFTLGGFYKELWNIDYIRRSRVKEGKYKGFMLTQPVNAEKKSTVWGFEVELQADLTLLPKPFDGFIIYLNYSHMKSKTLYPFFEIGPRSPLPPFQPTVIDTVREGPMPGQANDIANLTLGYEKGGFSGRLSLVYQGKSLSTVGTREELDGYSDDFFRWDLAFQQKIYNNFMIFLNFNNISNIPDRSFLGIKDFPTDEEFYGWTMDLGIRYKL